ncbi:MAG: sigma 54-interacting transcriptional regulator [Firmicutes bacterium]|nr:sigma 54-interacting transcriptional regulator [Bacillota bacterium]
MKREIQISEDMKILLDAMDNGIIITDADSIVLYVNPAFLKFAGLKEEQIVGKLLRSVRSHSQLHIAMENMEPIYNRRRVEDGDESFSSLIPIINNGQLLGGLCVVKEVGVLKALMDEMAEIRRKERYYGEAENSNFTRYMFDQVVGKNGGLKELIQTARRISISEGSILITGESGVGKEVLAQSIHNRSNRNEGPFIAVNCSAIPESLWESEFFGYTAGAFTGAKKEGKMGLFELAQGGTLFLDEVGEIPLPLQSKLLRVLEEGRIRKVGSEKEVPIDVRIIAATNKNIRKRVEEGEFRLDLYYRIAVFPVEIPPLRERREDIPEFIYSTLEEYNRTNKKNIRISQAAVEVLQNYDWPGNVRELKNVMEFTCSFQDDDKLIMPEDLPNHIAASSYVIQTDNTLKEMVKQYEKNIVESYIRKMGDSIAAKKEIAQMLGISLATLYNIIKE